MEWSHTIPTVGVNHVEDVAVGLGGTTAVLTRDFEVKVFTKNGTLLQTIEGTQGVSGMAGAMDSDGCGGITAVSQKGFGLWAAHPLRDPGCLVDSFNSIFESSIAQIGRDGITKGCNPPYNDRYCPNEQASRGEIAAIFVRGLELPPASLDYFIDDEGSIFEDAINRLAEAGITKGSNPPNNDRYCPTRSVTGGEIAAFFARGLDL